MRGFINKYRNYLIDRKVSVAPLAVFRFIFGMVMLISIVRFAANGWISEFYIEPTYFFTYYGFDWIIPLGDPGMYLVFIAMGISALFIALGYRYKLSAIAFFLLFTYVELLDKTYYLNHYYFVSIISFLLIFLPAHKSLSLDKGFTSLQKVPVWTINILILQIGLVYFFAGVAKINPGWLLEATPLKIWLPARSHFPVIGNLFNELWVAYVFSWGGMLYDITIPFLLLISRTRMAAYFSVIFFHTITWILFPIGMFPFIMIGLTIIFFPAATHEKLLKRLFNPSREINDYKEVKYSKTGSILLTFFIVLQLIIPWRFMLYPGNLFWTEQGYRFSWRVMLMEKTGMCTCKVKDEKDNIIEIDNGKFLTEAQEHMMATQPDMILQFAHYLRDTYREKGMENPEVYADCIVSLQGRRSRPFIDNTINLAEQDRGFKNKNWILPIEN